MKLEELKTDDIAKLSLDTLAQKVLELSLSLIDLRQQIADLKRVIDQKYGNIDSAIARDTNLANDWKRYDRQREWREADTDLQDSLAQQRSLWERVNLTEVVVRYFQSIRENRIAHMQTLSGSLLADITAGKLKPELN